MPLSALGDVPEVAHLDGRPVETQLQLAGDAVGMDGFVVTCIPEHGGEGLKLSPRRHDVIEGGKQSRRVQPAAQVHAHRHVAAQPQSHGVVQQLP